MVLLNEQPDPKNKNTKMYKQFIPCLLLNESMNQPSSVEGIRQAFGLER